MSVIKCTHCTHLRKGSLKQCQTVLYSFTQCFKFLLLFMGCWSSLKKMTGMYRCVRYYVMFKIKLHVYGKQKPHLDHRQLGADPGIFDRGSPNFTQYSCMLKLFYTHSEITSTSCQFSIIVYHNPYSFSVFDCLILTSFKKERGYS